MQNIDALVLLSIKRQKAVTEVVASIDKLMADYPFSAAMPYGAQIE